MAIYYTCVVLAILTLFGLPLPSWLAATVWIIAVGMTTAAVLIPKDKLPPPRRRRYKGLVFTKSYTACDYLFKLSGLKSKRRKHNNF